MAKHLIVLISLFMGAFLVLNALTSSMYVISNALSSPDTSPLAVVIGLLPIFVTGFIAFLIYKYATRIESPTTDIGDSVLYGGAKLLGLYFLIQGISRLLVSLGTLARADTIESTVYVAGGVAIIYLVSGYLLSMKTKTLLRVLERGDNA